MKLTITKAHLDKALSVPWDATTCLVAQAITETLGLPVKLCGGGGAVIGDNEFEVNCPAAETLARQFDRGYGSRGIKNQSELDSLRARLPVEVEMEVKPCDMPSDE